MRNFIVSLFVVFGLLIFGGLAFIYSGLFDVAASDPDWPVMRWVLQMASIRNPPISPMHPTVTPRRSCSG